MITLTVVSHRYKCLLDPALELIEINHKLIKCGLNDIHISIFRMALRVQRSNRKTFICVELTCSMNRLS